MFKQKISIKINTGFNKQELLEEFDWLLGFFQKTGQLQRDHDYAWLKDNELFAYGTTIERDSLAAEYNSEYARLSISKLEECCGTRLVTEVIAETTDADNSACHCTEPGFYVLFTHNFHHSSPVECGACRKVIPLYKLKGLSHRQREDILNWESNYKACDDLQMRCRVGEKWAMKQMSDTGSQLSKEGIEVCMAISEATGIPTYYYLFNYRHISFARDIARHCPSCGGQWLQSEDANVSYNFICHKCRLVSTLTSNAT